MTTLGASSFPSAQRGPSRLARPALAWWITAVTLAMFVAFAVILYSPITPPALFRSAGGTITGFWLFPFVSFVVVGGLLAARRPANPIGWLFLVAITTLIIGALGSELAEVLDLHHSAAAPWVLLVGVIWSAPFIPALLGLVIGLLLFPDGRLVSPRWRWLAYLAVLDCAVSVIATALNPTPNALTFADLSMVSPLAIRGAAGVLNALIGITSAVGYGCELGALVSVFLRFRDADADGRLQLRWFFTGASVTVGILTVATIVPALNASDPGPVITAILAPLLILGGIALPASVAVAVLKYRLYDIDVVISRTLVYGSLAVLITGVYVGIAVGIGELVGSGGKPNLGLSILATAIVAVGFQPVRERLQKVANRLVYGKRATPYEVLSDFSARVAETYAGEEVLPRMARILQQGTGAEAATVWLKSGGELRPAATHPDDLVGYEPRAMTDGTLPELPGATRVVAVRHQDETLGALSIVKRRGESLTPLEQKLLDDLAHQAGLVLKNVGLTADLQARLEELRQSRQRLVSAQDQERRRLERNLHDGAQQHLVALKVKLGLVEMLLARDAEKAKATLTQLKADADEALTTLRDLARGIYPPLLADKGLAAALESQARKATLPVSSRRRGHRPLSPGGRGHGVLLRPRGPAERAEVRRRVAGHGALERDGRPAALRGERRRPWLRPGDGAPRCGTDQHGGPARRPGWLAGHPEPAGSGSAAGGVTAGAGGGCGVSAASAPTAPRRARSRRGMPGPP